MIGYHCGQRIVPLSDNRCYFRVKCMVCKQVFKQHKRRSQRKDNDASVQNKRDPQPDHG